MVDWLNLAHLQKWWRSGVIQLEAVREKYLPRILGKEDVHPYIAFFEESPIGYIQYYDASAGDPNWWPDQPEPGVFGIDAFIGDENKLNRGIGTEMISKFVEFLFQDPSVIEIRIDPQPDNLRAIRCYEKAGFEKVSEIITPDGPAVMMILKR